MASGRGTGRAAWVALGILALALAAAQLRQSGPEGVGWLPGCLFHRFTGLHCPGCGMTQGTFALLNGRLAEAFRFNPVGMILLPLALAGIGLELAGWVRGRPLPWRLHFGKYGALAIAGVVIAFWILRNLPWWPFTLLAPP